MPTVTIEEAQNKLSELIHRLTPGEEVVITENDQPVARLVADRPDTTRKPRQFGTLKGTVLSMEHFDDPAGGFQGVHGMRLLLDSHTLIWSVDRPAISAHVGRHDRDGRPRQRTAR